MSPGLYGPRPGSGESPASDPEKTPIVRTRPPPLPPRPSPAAGTLAPLGRVEQPKLLTEAERVRWAIMSRVLRTCDALELEDLRLVAAFALRLRPGIGE